MQAEEIVPAAGIYNPDLKPGILSRRRVVDYQSPAPGWTVLGRRRDSSFRLTIGTITTTDGKESASIHLESGGTSVRTQLRIKLDPDFFLEAPFDRFEFDLVGRGLPLVVSALTIGWSSAKRKWKGPIQLNRRPFRLSGATRCCVPLNAATISSIGDEARTCKAESGRLSLLVTFSTQPLDFSLGAMGFFQGAAHALAALMRSSPPLELIERLTGEPGQDVGLVRDAIRLSLKEGSFFRLIDLGIALKESPHRSNVPEETAFEILRSHAVALERALCREEALEAYAEASRLPAFQSLSPELKADFRCDWAHLYFKTGRRPERLALLHHAVSEAPGHLRSSLELAADLAEDDAEAALEMLRLRGHGGVLSVKLLGARARILVSAGRPQEAVSEILGRFKGTVLPSSLRVALLNGYHQMGDFGKWEEVFCGWFPNPPISATCALSAERRSNMFERLVSVPIDKAAPAEGPLVAVIMTVFNACETVSYAVRSVLQQSYGNLRLIVVDDGSTDGSLSLLRYLASVDNRILILENRENSGTYIAKNRALKLVAADYYTFHDSDDWMHPERIERHVALMQADQSAVMSISRWIRVGSDGRVALGSTENHASTFFSRNVREYLGYFDSVRVGADREFLWRARRCLGPTAVLALPEVLTIGLQRPDSLTTGGLAGFDRFGHSPLRAEYARAWLHWHRQAEATRGLRMSFPQDERPFPAPESILGPSPEIVPPLAPVAEDKRAALVLAWPTNEFVKHNWGDKLSPKLVQLLSGRWPINRKIAPRGLPAYFVIGSSLAAARRHDVVWGSGFLNEPRPSQLRHPHIFAVRGPLSRLVLLAAGCDCPEVYGDPALLMPLFYNPDIAPSYDVGVIQHCREIGLEPLPLLPPGLSVRLIDITGGIEEVIDSILSCRRIFSSSLHGLIAAHAYGVPATWLKFSDRPLGDGFKFKDYWASMGRDEIEPIVVQPGAVLDPDAGVSTPGKPVVDLFALIKACPLIDEARKQELIARAHALAEQGLPRTIFRIHAGLL